ncbi:MAG: agmatinase [Pseudomonadota bacterium]
MKSPFERKLQFLDPGNDRTDADRSRVVVLPLPLEKTTSYVRGTGRGPEAIVEASTQVEFFDPELLDEPCRLGIHTDWSLADPAIYRESVEEILARISRRTAEHLGKGRFVLGLGGEHTVTVGLAEPYLTRFAGELTIVQIDAHADQREEYEGTPYSHACAMRRLAGRAPIVSVGVRALETAEYEAAPGRGVRIFFAHEIRKNPRWIEQVVGAIDTPNVYLTFDLDGLDPSIVPSVGTPVPGGLRWDESLDFLHEIARRHTIVGADVNELCPGEDKRSDFAAALLAYKIVGYALEKELRGRPV